MSSARGNDNQQQNSLVSVSPVSVAAHELKAPLALLRQLGYELKASDVTDTEREQLLEQVVQVSERAIRLTSNITRAETLQHQLFNLEPVNSVDVAHDVRRELTPLYKLYNRTLIVDRLRLLPPVVANRDLLHRILVNFADNALHYSGVDGAVELHAQLSRDRDTVRISVRDYGPALPLKRWNKLVRSLEGTQPVHARPQSSGLGIYIANQFASSMNGSIGAIRHRDGASFYVELPVSRQLSLL